MPEGHSVMDKALPAGQLAGGSNPVTTIYLSTLILTIPIVTCSSMNTCHMGGEKRGIIVKSKICVVLNPDIRIGERGLKKVDSFNFLIGSIMSCSPLLHVP